MASSIAASVSGGGGIIQTADSSGNLNLQSGTTTILALTSTGVAITGTLSATGVTTGAAGSAALPAITTTGDTDTGVWFPAANTLAASTAGVEAMRIDSSGNLLVGTTSAFSTAARMAISYAGNAAWGIGFKSTTSGAAQPLTFLSSTGASVGYIGTNDTTTSYVTSSDYRLKDNVTPMTGALATVAQLKPCNYKWIVDGSDGQGFIAHEIQAVVPDCVTGEKDAVDAEGKPKYQGIDTSFLVATLTAAIQEQQALITQLQTQITALNAKVGI